MRSISSRAARTAGGAGDSSGSATPNPKARARRARPFRSSDTSFSRKVNSFSTYQTRYFPSVRFPFFAAEAIASGVLPPPGTTFAGEKAVCASCSRVKEEKKFGGCKRSYEAYQETGRCLLEQGLVCQGVATQEGCGGLCTGVGVPCRGCFGKAPAIFDAGAKMVTAIASTFDTANAEEITGLVDGFVDLAGTLYRYSLPAQCSLLAAPPATATEGCDRCRG